MSPQDYFICMFVFLQIINPAVKMAGEDLGLLHHQNLVPKEKKNYLKENSGMVQY